MTIMTRTASFTALVVALAWPGETAANCAKPHDGYGAWQEGDRVLICLENGDAIECPAPSPMLRENVETGEVVQLANYCDPHFISHNSCYADECVPAGTYRYGMAEAYECPASTCGGSADLFVEIDVVDPSPECALSSKNTGVLAYEPSFLWKGGERSTLYCTSDGPLGSCAIAAPGAVDVFGLNLLVGLLGIVLIWRRKKVKP